MAKKKSGDYTSGPLFFPILMFSLPIMATGILQIFYNMMDQVVVGQFSGNPLALGAVGSTGSFYSLLANLAIGISVGAGVIVAHNFGARQSEGIARAVHTSFALSLIAGVLLGAVGFAVSRPMLVLMGTKAELLELATLYIRIVFLGMPVTILYNFGAAILRSVGDSRTPLILLSISGIINVLLNLFFVIVCHMSVEGVALATVLSQVVSAVAVWVVIAKREDAVRFRLKKTCLDRRMVREILRIGIPSGIQGSMFAISNMVLQSGVNTFDPYTVSGSTVGGTIEGFTYITMNSFYQSALTFTGQNHGARRPDRVKRVLWYSLLQVSAAGVLVGFACILFSHPLSSLFVDTAMGGTELIVAAARERMNMILSFYFLCGMMEVLTGHLRGKGHSVVTMLVTVFCTCVFRVLWVSLIFSLPAFHTLTGLYICYPVSWLLNILADMVVIAIIARREKREAAPPPVKE